MRALNPDSLPQQYDGQASLPPAVVLAEGNHSPAIRRRRFKKAIGYAIADSEAQRQEAEAAIRKYCDKEGLSCVRVIVDSSKDARYVEFGERPQGAELIRSFSAEKVRHVVVRELTKTFCDTVDAARKIGSWRRRGRHVHILDLLDEPFSTEDDRLNIFLHTVEALGRVEKWNLKNRMAVSAHRREVAGYVRGGTPYGYDKKGVVLITNSKEQAVIKRIRRMRAEDAPLNQIAKALNSEGVPTKKKGGKWYASTVRHVASCREETFEKPPEFT